jgi:hypothetical protein
MKILDRIAKIILLVGGLNWGLVGLTGILGMTSFNLVTTLLGFVNLASYANWVYLVVGVAAAYLSFVCFKKKDY